MILDLQLDLNETDNASLEELLALYDTYDGATYVNNVVLMIVYVPVFLVALLGNILVLLVIFGDVRAAKSSANYFLVNLALADLLGKLLASSSLCVAQPFFFFFFFFGGGGAVRCFCHWEIQIISNNIGRGTTAKDI